ncbi:COG3400 family protein [Helicobacter sp. T3_23-1056]
MKKVVLILDGIVAKNFLETTAQKYFSNNLYIVIAKDSSMFPEKIPSAFSCYEFDYTSSFHLEQVLVEHTRAEISNIFIIIENVEEKQAVFKICKKLCKDSRIVSLSKGFSEKILQKKDDKAIFIDETNLIVAQCVSRLPNVPVIPRGFGLGKGEIMEIGVPFGSLLAYRHIGSIQQKNFKIIGVYRQNELILATFSLVVQPQDIMLVAGEPKALNNLYKQVKSDIGQFPSPFGRDIYVYVDMFAQSSEAILKEIDEAIYLHSKIRSTKLFVNVLRPRDFDTIDRIKQMCGVDSSISLIFDYQNLDFRQKLSIDSEKKIGLIIIGEQIFSKRGNRAALFRTNSPVLKSAKENLKEATTCFVVLNEQMNKGENISSVIFDIAVQMKLQIEVYDFDPDALHQEDIIKDYAALAKSFGAKIDFVKTENKNPIFYLNELKQSRLHFLPFEECITKSRFFAGFSSKIEQLSVFLDRHPQLLVPISR